MTETENIYISPTKSEDVLGISKQTEIEKNIESLKLLCSNNAEYFSCDSTENGQRLYLSFLAIQDSLESLLPKIHKIQSVMHKYDFDEQVPGNGYRSFISVVGCAINHAIDLCVRVQQKRDSVLFRKSSQTKDIESSSHLLASLDSCLTHLEIILSWSPEGSLFPNEYHSPEELLSYAESINRYCFYGRSMGFQYCESLRNVLKFISLTMAIFSEAYYSRGSFITKATNSLFSTTRYITDPELKAKRIVNLSTYAGVDFCKAFWFLSENELMNQVPTVVSSSVAVSKVIHLPAEPFSITVDGQIIDVPVPSSHIGKKAVQVRLISHFVHEGMIGELEKGTKAKPPCPGLLVHCHGGGFVAQSSKSHECYLRDWAKYLKVPILSIDYSLAPEAPFPRALEEVTYAYCWALKNHELLGSTGERIVAAGDSAGANLLVTTTLKCITLGLPPPKGLFLAYSPIFVNFLPSPSRLLSMMDPLLPFGFLLRCLKAYAVPDTKLIQNSEFTYDNNSDTESFEEITESDLQALQAHKSPVSETSDTLTYGSFGSNLNDDNEFDLNAADVEESEKFVSQFLEKYALDSDTETEGGKIRPLESASSSHSAEYSIHSRVSAFVSSLRDRFSSMLVREEEVTPEVVRDNDGALPDDMDKVREDFKFSVPEDHLLSPILASDDLLRQLPPIKILTVELDPCLDDCVTFAKKLKSLNKDVTLDILQGLPHGFLNFAMFSKEAHEGSKLCVKRISELFDFSKKE